MDKKILPWFILTNIFMLVPGLPTPSKTYMRSSVLSAPDKYIVYWDYSDTEIDFEVHVKTTGFVGFGISPNGGMPGADIMVGGVKDGMPYAKDYYATDYATPLLDKNQQDWKLKSGRQDEGYTILKFSRAISLCDDEDMTLPEGTARLIWSYSEEGSATLQYHGTKTRGTKSLQLFGLPTGHGQTLPGDATTIDFLADDVKLPSKATEYHCAGFRVPTNITDTKHHIIRVDPVIQPGNERFVHHILLYSCNEPVDDMLHGHQDGCGTWFNDLPCKTVVAAWAVGADTYWYPKEAGYPIGGNSPITFFVMQLHYDNPAKMSDVIDSSGLRLWVTPTVRENDAGIIEAGHIVTPGQIIPPKMDKFVTESWCPNSCIRKMAPFLPKGINIFGVVLHTHLLGSGVRLRHFRNGHELKPIAEDLTYDFDLQNFRALPKIVNLKPTDDLMVECIYKSTDRPTVTLGGLGTREEMCLSFIAYYPAVPLSMCLSAPVDETIRDAFANAPNKPGASLEELGISLDWYNKTNTRYFQENINKGTIVSGCQDDYSFQTPPRIRSTFKRKNMCQKDGVVDVETGKACSIPAFGTTLILGVLASLVLMRRN